MSPSANKKQQKPLKKFLLGARLNDNYYLFYRMEKSYARREDESLSIKYGLCLDAARSSKLTNRISSPPLGIPVPP
jgi:hypothetical protein